MQTKQRHIPKDLTQTTVHPDIPNAIVHYSAVPVRGLIWAMYFKGKSSKPVHNWLVKPEQFQKSVDKFFNAVQSSTAAKVERRASIAASQMQAHAGIAVGTVLVQTWGYDQTNVDFYQVVAVLPKTLRVRPIGKNYRESPGLFMAGYATPCPGHYAGAAATIKPNKYRVWDGKPVYESHYA